MSRQTLPKLERKFSTHETTSIALSSGMGSRKSIHIEVNFDGIGNSHINFVVEDHGSKKHYQKYDLAVEAYNRLP